MALYDFGKLRQLLVDRGVAIADPISICLNMDPSQFNGSVIVNGQELKGFIYLNEWYREGAPKYHTRGCPAVVGVGGKDPRWRFATGFPVKYDNVSNNDIGIPQRVSITTELKKCGWCKPLDKKIMLRQIPMPIRGLDGRNMDWPEVSRKYREGMGYKCEKCNQVYPARYVHCHHIDGDKTNDAPSNLQCLCIGCHAEIHTTMKADREYKFFMEHIYDGR